MQLPHNFKRIRLLLARSKEFPQGSAEHGYEFVAPLDAKGHIDLAQWKTEREHCRVRRFWRGEDDQIGMLVHKPGSSEHARWVFDYDKSREVRRRERLSLRRTRVCARRISDTARRRRRSHVQGDLGRECVGGVSPRLDSATYFPSSTSTARIVGRCRAISCQLSPSSKLANTEPLLVPKLKSRGIARVARQSPDAAR